MDNPAPAVEYFNAYLDRDCIVALSRSPEGRLRERRVPAEHVSYHRVSELSPEACRRLRGHQAVKSFFQKGDWIRIGWADYETRKNAIRTHDSEGNANPYFANTTIYEGDVHPIRRWITESGVSIQKPRRVFFDLETDSRVPFVRAREGDVRILSWAAVKWDGTEMAMILEEDTDAAERALLDAFWCFVEDCDQLVAWGGDTFDFPILQMRSRLRGCRVRLAAKLYLDHCSVFKRMNMSGSGSGDEKTSNKLGDVSNALLGETKDDFDASRTWEAYAQGNASCADVRCRGCGKFHEISARACLLKYNLKDTRLLPAIEKKNGYLELATTLAQAVGVFADSRGLNPTAQVDAIMMRLGREHEVYFATKEYSEKGAKKEKFRGAYVQKPNAKGIEREVHVGDFRRMYPSIIITWNISPETKIVGDATGIPHCVCPSTGVKFRTDIRGLLPTACQKLIDLREEWTKKASECTPGTEEWQAAMRLSTAYKVAVNAFYGVLGSIYSRFFDKQIAESITQQGVWLIHKTQEATTARGMINIYADTDATDCKGVSVEGFTKFVKWCNEVYFVGLARECGCVTNDLYIAYEKAFDRIVFSGKKRYAARFLHYKGEAARPNSKPEIKGFEYKRGDTNKIARVLQEDIIRLLMGNWDPKCETCGHIRSKHRDGKKWDDRKVDVPCEHAHDRKLSTDEPCGCLKFIGIYPAPIDDPEGYHALLDKVRTYVLTQPLLVREVMISKTLTKELKLYTVKKKKDGTDAAQPRHVVVANVLEERGEDVEEGTRIGFVVLDAENKVVIPASDYTGELDRHYLWEKLVFPATYRLLCAAFPEHDWKSWLKTRPAKIRGKKKDAAEVSMGTNFSLPPPQQRRLPKITSSRFLGRHNEDHAQEERVCVSIGDQTIVTDYYERGADYAFS